MTKLTRNFSLEEFLVSDAAEEIGDPNQPTAEHLKNIQYTAEGFQELRDFFGRSIILTSGYRNPRVNAHVGGVSTSDHAKGFAGDCHVAGLTDLAAAKMIRDRMPLMQHKIDQLIYEKGRCVHVSFNPRARGQVLRQPGGPGSPVYSGLEP